MYNSGPNGLARVAVFPTEDSFSRQKIGEAIVQIRVRALFFLPQSLQPASSLKGLGRGRWKSFSASFEKWILKGRKSPS